MITVYCLFLHLVADFFLQSREMGQKKSVEFSWLMRHLIIQLAVFYLGLIIFVPASTAIMFALFNMCVHGVIDWNIWKLYKYSVYYRLAKEVKSEGARVDQIDAGVAKKAETWKFWEDSLFFDIIGVDQFLHAATLVLLAGALLS